MSLQGSSENTTVVPATTEEQDIALGVGLSIGLYVLVCVLVPLVGYVAFLWWKHDPFGLLFGRREYSVSSAGDKDSRRRNKAIATVSVELGNRGSDHPPLYTMKEQTLPKTKPGQPAEELTESFVYTPPDTSSTSNGHQHTRESVKTSPEPQVSFEEKAAAATEEGHKPSSEAVHN